MSSTLRRPFRLLIRGGGLIKELSQFVHSLFVETVASLAINRPELQSIIQSVMNVDIS